MRALVVTSSEKSQKTVAGIIALCGGYETDFAKTPAEAIEKLRGGLYELVIVNNESAQAKEAALTAAERKDSGVIFIEAAADFEKTAVEMMRKGIAVIAKPLSKTGLLAAVQTVHAAAMRLDVLREENRELNKKIEDMKIINRAKIALIERLGYTEDEAHKYIEKQAMNLRTSKREVAVNILKTYEY